MMVSPKEILNIYIRENISPLLKKSGFLKSGKTWTKQLNDITYVFNIQSNKWSVSGKPVEFFINYGIYSRQLFEKRFNSSILPKYPKEYDCFLRKRLHNIDDDTEVWIIELNKEEASDIGLLNSINNQIFPFFNKIKNDNDLDKYMSPKKQ